MPVVVKYRTGVDREVQARAESRHRAPVLDEQAAAFVRPVPNGVEFVAFPDAIVDDEVGQTRPRLRVERTPMVARAEDFVGGNARQAFACRVPDKHAALAVDNKGRHGKTTDELKPASLVLGQRHGRGFNEC